MDKLLVSKSLNKLLSDASIVYKKNFSNACVFERAIFLSWYCSKGDCTFCYMSTQKNKIKGSLNMAKRRRESLVTEAILCKALEWNIEFLSGGYDSYTDEELLRVVKLIYAAYGKKLWLNIGLLTKKQVEMLKQYSEGVCGSIECLNPKLHDKLCPSKPIQPIVDMLDYTKSLGLKSAITIIIGLGETIEDFRLLESFIKKHNIDRVTFYRLNPHKGTPFKKGPDSAYYAEWIAKTRMAFPKIEIIAGSWVDKLSEIHLLLQAGANNITKFPSTGMFGTVYAKNLEKEVKIAKRKFVGSLTKMPKIDWNKLVDDLDDKQFDSEVKAKIKFRLADYIKNMQNAKNRKKLNYTE